MKLILPLALLLHSFWEGNCLLCRSCEGDTCNYNQMTVNCEFPVTSCMRIYSITGRTYKAGCLYPVENCERTRVISGEQMQCFTCNYDNCNGNNNQAPYRPDSFGPYGPGGGQQPFYPGDRGQQPYYPGDGRFRPYPYGQGGRYGYGYHWNGATSPGGGLASTIPTIFSCLALFLLAILLH